MGVLINGVLKGVTLKSKLNDRDEAIHNLELKMELVKGEDPAKVQEAVEHLREMIELGVQPIQPALPEADE